MIEVKPKPRVQRRRRSARREPAFKTKSFSLPVDIALKVETEADLKFGGNESALATAAFCRELGIEPKVEYALE